MVLRATIVATAAALLAGASSGGGPAAAEQSRVLWQGPVLAGSAVVWGEEAGAKASLHLWTQRRPERIVYSSDSLDLGRPLAASSALLAFERSYPGCPPQPNIVCPQKQDALAGPPLGPFKTLVPAQVCAASTGRSLATDAGVAAYLEVDCTRNRVRVAVRDVGHNGRPLVLRDAAGSSGCCSDVAIAGRYVAWNDRGDVVVYDRLARRGAYRAVVRQAAGGLVDLGFDLQADGKVAVAYRSTGLAQPGPTTVAWFSSSAQDAHVLPLRGRGTFVRIAGDRIAFERFVTARKSALVVTDLDGGVQAVARFASPKRLRGGFDFDGRQIVWASDRVTSTRVDCPPPGQGRPCVRRETGVTRIWLRRSVTGPTRMVARLPFDDTIAQP